MSIVHSSQGSMDPQPQPERRSFLGLMICIINTGIAAFMAVTLGRFVAGPKTSTASEPEWLDAGSISDVPDGKPARLNVTVAQDAGWAQFDNQQSVWIVKKGDNVQVFSAVCPHLGCSVNTNANGFICPCHTSTWNINGQRMGGPTLRGLDTLEHKIEDGTLKVKYQFFKQGLAGKEPIA